VKHVARQFGLVASFMPKPIFGQNGSGMHTHQSLFRGDQNAFWDANAEWQLSPTALSYIGGLLRHARGMCAVTNPLVNSYKRLQPGFEAPTHIVWSERNRSPMVRVPERRGDGTRIEVRTPDPSCNPYLAFAAMIAAGLDGVRRKLDPDEPINKNIFALSAREKRRFRIEELPRTLDEAVRALKKDDVVQAALGPHITQHYVEAKLADWRAFAAAVHPWEIERYLARY
jgi:glutamine synthetase